MWYRREKIDLEIGVQTKVRRIKATWVAAREIVHTVNDNRQRSNRLRDAEGLKEGIGYMPMDGTCRLD